MRCLCLLIVVAGCGRVGFDDTATVVAMDLRAEWTTANAVRWLWTDPSELGVDAAALELIVAPARAGFAADEAIVFAASANPELGFLDDDTITDGLAPGTDYLAQLRFVDASQTVVARSLETPIATTTADPSGEVVIFADQATDGYSIPSDFVHSDERPFGGTHCYRFVGACDVGEASCFENLRRQGIDHDLAVISDAAWPSAFVEFAVAADGDVHSEWSQVRFMMRDRATDETRVFSFGGFTIRADGDYRVYQIPLRALLDDDAPLTPSVAANDSLFEFGIGGTWSASASVRLDEVRVRH